MNLIQRDSNLKHFVPLPQANLDGKTDSIVGTIYEMFTKVPVIKMEVNIMLVSGIVISVRFAATKPSGNEHEIEEQVKHCVMCIIMGQINRNKTVIGTYGMLTIDYIFSLDDSLNLTIDATSMTFKSAEGNTEKMTIFNPSLAEDF
jgi:hypothetical protein